jgi:hypothetical protein
MTGWFLTGEDVVITDFQGQQIRLTVGQWNHVLAEHPYMSDMEWAVRETLEDPEEVRQSRKNPNTGRLYYRWYTNTALGNKWVLVIVKFLAHDAFISTAYVTNRIRPGGLIWRK